MFQQLLHDRGWDGARLGSNTLWDILIVDEELLRSFRPLMELHVGKHISQGDSTSVPPFSCERMVALHRIDPSCHGQYWFEHVSYEGSKGSEFRIASLQFNEQRFK